MRVYIVGAGAIGTWFGDTLRNAGCEVVYAPRELALVEAVDVELAVVAVKAFATPGAIATLQRALPNPQQTAILSLQNGIGNEEQLAAAFGRESIIAGALTVPVERLANGSAVGAARGGLGIAPCGTTAHNWLIALLQQTKLPIVIAASATNLKWSKLSLNIIANATAAILDFTPAEIVGDSALFALERAALLELRAVFTALGITPLDLPRYPVRALLQAARLPLPLARAILAPRIARARGAKAPSLLLDLAAGKSASEVGVLNGAIAAAGRTHGVPTPINAGLERILESIVATPTAWERYRKRPAALLRDLS